MCESCSPLCGNCKPAAAKVLLCPACGKGALLTREECLLHLGRPHRLTDAERVLLSERSFGELVCEGCGADLIGVLRELLTPRGCAYGGVICGYPCGRSGRRRDDGESPCATQVPMGRLPG